MESILTDFSHQIQAKKDKIVRDRFAEKGFAHLLENIEKSRFKRVVVESEGGFERWFADDGTENGVLIVTFFSSDVLITPINLDDGFKITTQIHYY